MYIKNHIVEGKVSVILCCSQIDNGTSDAIKLQVRGL